MQGLQNRRLPWPWEAAGPALWQVKELDFGQGKPAQSSQRPFEKGLFYGFSGFAELLPRDQRGHNRQGHG